MGAWELGFLALSTTRPSRLQSQEEALTPVKHAPSFSMPTAPLAWEWVVPARVAPWFFLSC